MADFSLPSWLQPREAPWHALIAGAQAGSAIAANRLRSKALYADIQQNQQRQDLAEREFIAKNEAQTLSSEVIRLKMQNDAHDFEQLRSWWPLFSTATGDALRELPLPELRNTDRMQQIATMLTHKRQAEGVAEFAEVMAQVDLATPEGQEQYWSAVRRNPAIAGKMGLNNLMMPVKTAEDLKRLQADAASRISKRATDADALEKRLEILSEHTKNQDEVAALRAEIAAAKQETDSELAKERLAVARGKLQVYEQAVGIQQSNLEMRRERAKIDLKRLESKLPEADRIKLQHELNVLREQLDNFDITPAEYYKKRDEVYGKYTPKTVDPAVAAPLSAPATNSLPLLRFDPATGKLEPIK